MTICHLSELFHLDCDLAGARNHSQGRLSQQIWSEDLDELNRLKWKTRSDVYINGGVLFYNDTLGAHQFAENWHRLWLHSYSITRRYRDQPALNMALHSTVIRLNILPDSYNTQIKRNLAIVRDAIIWHYYSSVNGTPCTRFDDISRNVLVNKIIDDHEIRSMIYSFHPWRRATIIDDLMANRIIKRGIFDGYEAAWLRRNYRIFLMSMIKTYLKS